MYSGLTVVVFINKKGDYMAFHNPDPKMREIEERNAAARAALFRWIWRGLYKALTGRLKKPRKARR